MRNTKLTKLWDALHSSYWFLPSLMSAIAILLAFIILNFDRTNPFANQGVWWLYTGGPDGARSVLSSIAGSMITVAGTAFSITIVALQLAASNYGPRLLRNFMRDTGNQIVLGTFLSTFIYCLLVLRTIHAESFNLFVPQISVTVGIGFAIASVAVLIYFIHHASTIIQASHIIKGASDELDDAVDRLFPAQIGQSLSEDQQRFDKIPDNFETAACSVPASRSGYLQMIDDALLMKLARQRDVLIRVEARPGTFIAQGNALVSVFPRTDLTPKLTRKLNQAFMLGSERTEQQDVEFPIDQLVEIALRAISPAVNDPFTAIRCIDRLGAGLSRLAQREFPSPYRYDQHHKLRVIAEPVRFEGLVETAFSPIRQYARSDRAVTLRLLDALIQIANSTDHPSYQAALKHQAEMIVHSSQDGLTENSDRQSVEERYQLLLHALMRVKTKNART